MTKISIKPNCGNAPRKLFLKELNIAFAKGDIDFVAGHVAEDIRWILAGRVAITGRANYLATLKKRKTRKAKELNIDTIITHGREACVSGQLVAANSKRYLFCDVYTFKGAGATLITSITSFITAQ